MGKVPLFDWLSSGDVPLDESDVVIQGTRVLHVRYRVRR
jgi:hypothetical protein